MRYPLNKESAYKTVCSNPKSAISGFRDAAALCSLAILPLTLSQTVEFETMSDLVNRGANAFAEGDYLQAASAFQKLESIYSQEPEWKSNRLGAKIAPFAGYAALKAGLFDQAISSFSNS